MTKRRLAPNTRQRADDETALHMVKLRASGLSSFQIAQRLGTTNEAVRIATNRIRKDDEAHEGRDLSTHYWPTDKGRRHGQA